jgi:NCAIR mutase (PurE)-related protein
MKKARDPVGDLGFARVDHDRARRCGFPEVILGRGKSPAQVAAIFRELASRAERVLATRCTPDHFAAVRAEVARARWHEAARAITWTAGRAARGTGAGIHRLFRVVDRLRAARAVVVVAGMEGALPSVVGGLVAVPVVAVPTSVGYGAAFEGLAALLGMVNSCAAGVSVVNIDNGFGAGYISALINRGANGSAGRGARRR